MLFIAFIFGLKVLIPVVSFRKKEVLVLALRLSDLHNVIAVLSLPEQNIKLKKIMCYPESPTPNIFRYVH